MGGWQFWTIPMFSSKIAVQRGRHYPVILSRNQSQAAVKNSPSLMPFNIFRKPATIRCASRKPAGAIGAHGQRSKEIFVQTAQDHVRFHRFGAKMKRPNTKPGYLRYWAKWCTVEIGISPTNAVCRFSQAESEELSIKIHYWHVIPLACTVNTIQQSHWSVIPNLIWGHVGLPAAKTILHTEVTLHWNIQRTRTNTSNTSNTSPVRLKVGTCKCGMLASEGWEQNLPVGLSTGTS